MDTISREQAIGALSSLYGYDENHPDIAPAIEEILSLPSIAPDPIEAEYREAAVAWAEARYAMQCGCEDFCPHEAASIKAGIRFSAARAARDAR